MPKLRLAALAAVVTSACSVSGPTTGQVVAAAGQAPVGGGDDGCPRSECGGSGNSPVMDGVYFWSLNLDRKPNNQGFSLLSAAKLGIPVDVAIADPGDRLIARYKASPFGVLEHQDLVDVTMLLVRDGRWYHVRVAHVSPLTATYQFWVGPGQIENYDMRYTPLEDGEEVKDKDGRPDEHWLCSHPSGDPEELNAIVFNGDVYDADRKTITVGPDAVGWFNIACYKGAPWKMHMMGHTGVANARLDIAISVDKRRALLNAWTMNACGTGKPFTHPDEPITLHEQPDLLPAGNHYLDPSVTHEAIWGATGALCLDTPRLSEEDSEIRSKIQDECGGKLPPPCERWPAGGLVSTGNPREP